MSYTPGTDFDFTGEIGYTPSAGFDFSGGTAQPYNLGLEQDWSLTAPAIEAQPLGQSWALRAASQGERPTDQGWAMETYLFADRRLGQSWVLHAPVFKDSQWPQRWAQPIAVFGARGVDGRWTLAVPAFADLAPDQRWALLTPEFLDALQDQSWGLAAPAIADYRLRQSWSLTATAVWTRVVSSIAYLFALEQGVDRVEIPVSSFSGRLRSGDPSYLQVAIPDPASWAETIAAYAEHADTEMVITAGYRWSDGEYVTTEIARVTLRNVRYDYGAKSSTCSLDGLDTRINTTPKAVTLTGASYRSIADSGLVRYRCGMDFSVRPGDTVTVEGDTFTVGELSYQVGADSAVMEVAEAAPA